jgi:2-polyprenyl-6-methoxyphenol hydroxylase-like FAD-dependent oxidoreductase
MSSSSTPHALIVGAGLGGLTLAQSLRKGISFEIFERDDGDLRSVQGWVISIHS